MLFSDITVETFWEIHLYHLSYWMFLWFCTMKLQEPFHWQDCVSARWQRRETQNVATTSSGNKKIISSVTKEKPGWDIGCYMCSDNLYINFSYFNIVTYLTTIFLITSLRINNLLTVVIHLSTAHVHVFVVAHEPYRLILRIICI